MRPANFREANKILARPKDMTDKQCGPLPIHTDGENCLSCWKMSFFERLKALIFGKIWIVIWSGTTQPPISLACWKNAFKKEKKSETRKS